MQYVSRRPNAAYLAPVLAGLIAFVAAIYIWHAYDRAVAQVARMTRADARAAAAYAREVFVGASLALQSLDAVTGRATLVVRGSPRDLHVAMARAQASTTTLVGLTFIGPDGKLVTTAASERPVPADVSGRPYFRYLRDTRDYALQIAPPVVSQRRGVIGIPVALRAETESGDFAGVVAGLVDPERFASFFATLDSGIVSLVDANYDLYARSPPVELVGAKAGVRPALDDAGAVTFASSTDNAETRFVAVERVDGTGLYALASVPYATVVEAWLGSAAGAAGIAVLAIVLAFLAAEFVKRRVREADERLAATSEDAAHFRSVARNKSDFLAHMGHEIRTPINAIVGFADVIATDAMKLGAPQRYREYAADIRFSADHLLAIIASILDMSKIEAGKWKLSLGSVDSTHVLSTVRHLAQQRAAKEGVSLRIDEGAGNIPFVADERVVVQILLNLTINAIKFAGEDRLVRLGCRAVSGERIEFAVVDHGRGMTDDQARRVLEPFETAGDGDRRSDTGLGLPLSLMFARLHGGTIEIDTAPAKGTRVRVLLPVRGPQPAADVA